MKVCFVFSIESSKYPVWPHTFISPSADSRGAVVSYWRKYVHEVLVNRLGGLSLPRKSVVRLTDRPDMTLDVYRGRKTTKQQLNYPKSAAMGFFLGTQEPVRKMNRCNLSRNRLSNLYGLWT